MTSSLSNRGKRSSMRAAFTLVEVMVSATLGAIILAGTLTTFLMLGRNSMRVVNYSLMEKQTRLAFEQLGIDARMASDITSIWNGNVITGFTLIIPNSDLTTVSRVTYAYSNSTFYLVPGSDPAETNGRRNLITNVTSLNFSRYDKNSALLSTSTTSDSTVKHIQASVSVVRSNIGVAAATQVIRSTAFTIRNKTST